MNSANVCIFSFLAFARCSFNCISLNRLIFFLNWIVFPLNRSLIELLSFRIVFFRFSLLSFSFFLFFSSFHRLSSTIASSSRFLLSILLLFSKWCWNCLIVMRNHSRWSSNDATEERDGRFAVECNVNVNLRWQESSCWFYHNFMYAHLECVLP